MKPQVRSRHHSDVTCGGPVRPRRSAGLTPAPGALAGTAAVPERGHQPDVGQGSHGPAFDLVELHHHPRRRDDAVLSNGTWEPPDLALGNAAARATGHRDDDRVKALPSWRCPEQDGDDAVAAARAPRGAGVAV